MSGHERRHQPSRLPDLRELVSKLQTLARQHRPVALLYIEFAAEENTSAGSIARGRTAAYKQATAAALKSAIGTVLRSGDLAAAGAGGRWFIVLLAARAHRSKSHSQDADLGIAAERLRQTVQHELLRATHESDTAHLSRSLRVRCGWNVLEPAANPLEALRHAVRGAALVARIEERRATILAAITHELRTPLTAIIGFAERLRHDKLEPAQRTRSLDIIIDESKRLHRLAEGLIDSGAWTAGSLRLDLAPARLADIVTRAAGAVGELAISRQVKIGVSGDALAVADRERCMQIFINLLDNAIRFSPRGGRVDVRIAREGNRARVTFSDRGPGFGAQIRGSVGSAFNVGANGKVGLGLAIASLLAEAHGGGLRVGRRAGGGMVAVTFQAAHDRAARIPQDRTGVCE